MLLQFYWIVRGLTLEGFCLLQAFQSRCQLRTVALTLPLPFPFLFLQLSRHLLNLGCSFLFFLLQLPLMLIVEII